MRSLEDLLDLEEPQSVLRLKPVEEQAMLRALVLLRRRLRPPFPLPSGKTYNFYVIHNPSTGGATQGLLPHESPTLSPTPTCRWPHAALTRFCGATGSTASAVVNSLRKRGARVFLPELVTVHGVDGSHSRWHQPGHHSTSPGSAGTPMGLALSAERQATGTFRFAYGAGGGQHAGTTESPSSTRELSAQTLLDRSGTLDSLLASDTCVLLVSLVDASERVCFLIR